MSRSPLPNNPQIFPPTAKPIISLIPPLHIHLFPLRIYQILRPLSKSRMPLARLNLTAIWCEHDSDAIDSILDPVADCLKQLILSNNPPSEPIQLMIGSQLIEVGIEPWVPFAIKSMSLEDATKIVQETF